jgi:hypothetical protein
MREHLKLVTLYDATRHEYTLYRHNLTEDEANEAVRELSARLFGLFIIDQHTKHSADGPEECRACRREVEQSSHVQPKPKFKRRQE